MPGDLHREQVRRGVMTPGEVADLFRVDPKTVTRWVTGGRFPVGTYFKTPGGHHRFYRDQVENMLNDLGNQA